MAFIQYTYGQLDYRSGGGSQQWSWSSTTVSLGYLFDGFKMLCLIKFRVPNTHYLDFSIGREWWNLTSYPLLNNNYYLEFKETNLWQMIMQNLTFPLIGVYAMTTFSGFSHRNFHSTTKNDQNNGLWPNCDCIKWGH